MYEAWQPYFANYWLTLFQCSVSSFIASTLPSGWVVKVEQLPRYINQRGQAQNFTEAMYYCIDCAGGPPRDLREALATSAVDPMAYERAKR